MRAWWEPTYVVLVPIGRLADEVPPWGPRARGAIARVLNPGMPCVTSDTGDLTERVLPQAQVVDALLEAFRASMSRSPPSEGPTLSTTRRLLASSRPSTFRRNGTLRRIRTDAGCRCVG